MISEVDRAVRESLTDFFREIRALHWRGREREAVSLYAFGFLLKQCSPGRPLHDPAQIGIEVAVPGIGEVNRKRQVCKDLVIWRTRGMTCWDDGWAITNSPLAILEWKVGRRASRHSELSAYDLAWLTRFSSSRRDFAGYVVSLNVAAGHESLAVGRVRRGKADSAWLQI